MAVAAVVTIGLLASKTHVSFVFFALASGYMVGELAGYQIEDSVGDLVGSSSFPVDSAVRVALLLLPVLVVAFKFRKSRKGVLSMMQQALLAGAAVALGLVLVLDRLPRDTRRSISSGSDLAVSLPDNAGYIAMFALSLAVLDIIIMHGPKKEKKKGPKGE